MNRNKDIFGPDVEIFRPERWIDNTPEQLQAMRKHMGTVSNQATLPANQALARQCEGG